MMNSGLAQPPNVASGQHNPQMKVSQQTAASHQGGHFMNLPAAAAYPGYSGLYYNTFAQYPPILVPQNAKHSVNVTSAFQPHNPGFASAYSSTANVNASSTNNSLHNMQVQQDQSFGKNHVSGYGQDKPGQQGGQGGPQQASFHHQHHNTNTPPPPFNLQTLTAAMAAANNSGAGAGAAPAGISPYTQTYMPMLPTAHPSSQIHLHLQQQHGGELGQNVGPQRSQHMNVYQNTDFHGADRSHKFNQNDMKTSNQLGKNPNKSGGNFGGSSQYWGN